MLAWARHIAVLRFAAIAKSQSCSTAVVASAVVK
jgi:hypothetical protein